MYSKIKNLNIDYAKSVSDEQINIFEKELLTFLLAMSLKLI